MTFRVGIVLAVLGALLAGACGGSNGSSKSSSADEPLVVDDKVNLEAMQARVDEFVALSTAQQEAKLASLDSALERELWKVSGLEAALGGAAAADAAFAAHSKAITAKARAIADQKVVLQAFHRADSAPSIGAGLFGGMMAVSLGAEAVVSMSNDFKDGQQASGTMGENTTVSASLDHAEMDISSQQDSNGVTSKLRVKIEVNPCPDSKGRFSGKARVETSATASGGSAGQTGIVDVQVTGEVDDDAKVASSDVEYKMQWAESSGAKSGLVEVKGAVGDKSVKGATVSRSAGTATAEMQSNASSTGMLYAMLAKLMITQAAQKGWESGRCVVLKPTAAPGPSGMKPNSTSQIVAPPRSRMDGTPTGGTVIATLSAGGASVAPSASKERAPAKFTYKAPDEENKTGTVSLEARSKRGVAKASIAFDTNAVHAYHVVGGLQDFQVNQDVCDVMKPFSLNGQVGTADFSGGLSGTYVANGMFNFHYEGTYSIKLPDGPGQPGTMSASSGGSIANQAGSGTEKYKLTPLENCG